MRIVAWDTWAFIETALENPRRAEIDELLAEVDAIVTVREVVVETFNYLVRKSKSQARALTWWNDLVQSRVRILQPEMNELRDYVSKTPTTSQLSLVDQSLAYAATRERIREIATEDAEFRLLGLEPLFARR